MRARPPGISCLITGADSTLPSTSMASSFSLLRNVELGAAQVGEAELELKRVAPRLAFHPFADRVAGSIGIVRGNKGQPRGFEYSGLAGFEGFAFGFGPAAIPAAPHFHALAILVRGRQHVALAPRVTRYLECAAAGVANAELDVERFAERVAVLFRHDLQRCP